MVKFEDATKYPCSADVATLKALALGYWSDVFC